MFRYLMVCLFCIACATEPPQPRLLMVGTQELAMMQSDSPERAIPTRLPRDLTATEDKDHDGYLASVDCNDYDGSIFPGASEFCDYIDNDCDGVTDNPWHGTWGDVFGKPCLVQSDEGCVSEGIWVCDFDHDWLVCSASPMIPSYEKCNGIDDDCNGVTDTDAYPELGMACSVVRGTCVVTGVWVCDDYGAVPGCTGDFAPLPDGCTET